MSRKRRNDSKIDLIYKAPDGREMTGREWCKVLGICTWAFLYRVRNYGHDNQKTFLTKKESRALQLKNHANPGRRKAVKKAQATGCLVNRGNAEWQALGDVVRG